MGGSFMGGSTVAFNWSMQLMIHSLVLFSVIFSLMACTSLSSGLMENSCFMVLLFSSLTCPDIMQNKSLGLMG